MFSMEFGFVWFNNLFSLARPVRNEIPHRCPLLKDYQGELVGDVRLRLPQPNLVREPGTLGDRTPAAAALPVIGSHLF